MNVMCAFHFIMMCKHSHSRCVLDSKRLVSKPAKLKQYFYYSIKLYPVFTCLFGLEVISLQMD